MHVRKGILILSDPACADPRRTVIMQLCAISAAQTVRQVVDNECKKIVFNLKNKRIFEIIYAEGAHALASAYHNYSVDIPTWSSLTQRRRLSARRAARIAGWPS